MPESSTAQSTNPDVPTNSAAAPYRQTTSDVLQSLQTDAQRGLTVAEVKACQEKYGPNALEGTPPLPWWKRLLHQFLNPLTFLLLGATLVSFVAWRMEGGHGIPYEALTILIVVLLNAILGYVQEARAEQVIASLQKMTEAHATVLRDGQQQSILAAELVPGDILLLDEGKAVPADGRLLEVAGMTSAEAALTGESVPVEKQTNALEDKEIPLGDRTNMVFRGALVAAGHGKAVVTATGMQTELGKIAGLLEQEEQGETPLQKQLDTVGKYLGLAVVSIAIIVAITIIGIQQVRSTSALLTVLIYAVSLAVSAVPEGLTVITTVVLSMGVQKMAKRNVIIRRLAAVETLGSATVICTDKTGTLTRNEMTVRVVLTASGRAELTGIGYTPEGEVQKEGRPVEEDSHQDELEWALRAASLDNNARLVEQEGKRTVLGDPTEGALIVAAEKAGLQPQALEERFERVQEAPFSSERKRMSTLHKDHKYEDAPVLFSKGAPDVLLKYCVYERAGAEERLLTQERREEIQASIEGLANEALRTLGVAYRRFSSDHADSDNLETLEEDLIWVGVIGMIDPPRSEAKEAVEKAHRAGVRVIMITGDHPVSAAAIAAEIGIAPGGSRAITGVEIEKMSDADLNTAVKEATVFARVDPEHKLRIVRALKANGEIVAMTGDGANDAPALKSADIGVAMGITGTDVAKEAADMVLTDDNFATIVAAIEEGRAIYANIQKFLAYLLSSNLGEVLVMFFGVVLAGVLGLKAGEGEAVTLPLLATMVLWINLLTDTGPALALGVEASDPDGMNRPPRDPSLPVITRAMWIRIIGIGAVMAIGTLLALDMGLPGGLVEANGDIYYARTLAFTTLVLFQLFNVFNVRSDYNTAFSSLASNLWLWASVLGAVGLQLLVIYLPPLQKSFGTVPLSPRDWLLCTGIASSVILAVEVIKIFLRVRQKAEE